MSLGAEQSIPTSLLDLPIISYQPDGTVIANATPQTLAEGFRGCCGQCGKMAVEAATEIIDFASAPSRNQTVGKALEVLAGRVIHRP